MTGTEPGDRMSLTAGIALGTLSKIVHDYQTPEEIKENCEEEYGLDYIEALEMAYENMQGEAKATLEELKKLNGGKS